MNARLALLKRMIAHGTYSIDERAIAEAILVRSMGRSVVSDLAFRCVIQQQQQQMRSFRPHRGARSFRLARADRRSLERHVSLAARSDCGAPAER
jgi:hypothetical protein